MSTADSMDCVQAWVTYNSSKFSFGAFGESFKHEFAQSEMKMFFAGSLDKTTTTTTKWPCSMF